MTHEMRSVPLEAGQPGEPASAFAALGGGTWEADAGMTRIDLISPSLERLLGIAASRWREDAGLWLSRVHPMDREAALRARTTPGERVVEYRIFAADGRLLWLREALRVQDGRLRSALLDITRERALSARLAAQTELTTLLASASSFADAVPRVLRAVGEALGWELGSYWRHDAAEGALVCEHVWSARPAPAFEAGSRALKLPPGVGLPGRALREGRAAWVPDAARDGNLPRAQAAAADGLRAGIATPIRRGERAFGVLEFYLREERAPDDGLMATLEGVGAQLAMFLERREAEERLHDVSLRRGAILESALDCLVTIDAGGRVVEWNPAAERTFGYSAEEAIGREMAELILPPELRDAHRAELARHLAAGEPRVLGGRVELPAVAKDGRRFPAEVAIVRIPVPGKLLFTGHIRDISTRKGFEGELQASEARYRFLADSIPQQVWTALPDGRLDYVNRQTLDYFASPAQAILDEGWRAHVHPEDAPRASERWARALATGEPYEMELRLRRSDGQYRWHIARAVPQRDASGRVQRWYGCSTDIEETKRAEEKLRESRERLDLALDAAALGAWDLDIGSDTAVRSLRHDQIFGYDALQPEWGAERFLRHVVPEHRERVKAAFDEAFRAGRLRFECRIERVDGSHAWIAAQGAVLYAKGRPARMLGVVADITQSVRAKEEMEAAGARTSAILESISDAFFTLDRSWRFTYVNGQAEAVLGRKREELLGRVLWDEYPAVRGTRFEAAYLRAMEEGAPGQVEDHYPEHNAWYDVKIYPSVDGLSVYFQNVSERKRSERELQESRERLDLALGAAELGAWDLDLLADTAVRSDRHDEIFGYSTPRPDWSTAIFLEHVHPGDRDLVRSAFEEGLARGRVGFECRIQRTDGALRWINVQGRVLHEGGRPVRMLGVVGDVTERRHVEDAVRESEARYRFLAENARDMITRSTPDGRMLYVSPAVRRLLGYEPEELLGRRSMELVHPDDVQRVRQEREQIAASDVARTVTLRFRRKDGSYVWLEAAAQAVHDPKTGALVELVAASRDVTDRKLAEQALEERARELAQLTADLQYQTDLMRTITENAASALFMMDGRGHPVFLNEAAKAMTGYASIEDIKDRPLHEAIHFLRPDGSPYPMDECPIDRANADIRPLKDQREVFCRKDGALFPVEYNVAPVVRNGERRGAVLEVRDITAPLRYESELRERAEELARLTEALQRSNSELDQFAYVTSHDLKAPLRGIANLSRWIEEDVSAHLTDESREHLELLRGRVTRMEALIDAILEYSRVGRVRARPETVDTGALLADIVDLLAPPAGFTVRAQSELPTLVAEKMPLQQVLMNLVANAIKHHHDRSRGSVVVSAEDAGDMWRFRVQDDGPGIAPRFHEKIFVIFQTLEPRDKVEGTGIGLALVKKIVESYGGRISVESDVGKGATFEFTWPKYTAEGRHT